MFGVTNKAAALCGIVLAAQLLAVSAFAGPLTWDLEGGNSHGSNGNIRTFYAEEDAGVALKARAYYRNSNGFNTAKLGIYSGGLGVNIPGQGTGSPNHSTDNNNGKDFILFEFSEDNFNPLSIMIGWRYSDADIQIWIGGAGAGLNLANNVDICGGACDYGDFGALGFQQAGIYENLYNNQERDLNTTLTGRYLLLSGQLDERNDYFKVSQLVAERQIQVPEPGTLLLLGLGLAGVGLVRRHAR